MDFTTHVREALTNLVMAKLRSFLAILGVLVGTGSVVALISSSQLATSHALQQFKALGTNLLSMSIEDRSFSASDAEKRQFKLSEVPELIKASKQLVSAAPYINVYAPISFGGKRFSGQILGATEELAEIAKIGMQRGRFVSVLDKHSFFCVVGAKLAVKISEQGVDPLYQQVRVGNDYCTVIGIAKPWTPNLFLYANINDGLVVPILTSYLISSHSQIRNVLLRLIKKPNLDLAQQQLTSRLKQLLPEKKVEFRNPEQIINIVASQRKTFTWLLAAIGGISLLVGGIGVMNIMLVSVVERRHEIGIRMAIGARRKDIMQMFLIESIILTLFGGLFGIILGVGVSYILAIVTKWEFHLYFIPPGLGFAVSVLVGVVSGLYPSYRASRLDPIQTLQSD